MRQTTIRFSFIATNRRETECLPSCDQVKVIPGPPGKAEWERGRLGVCCPGLAALVGGSSEGILGGSLLVFLRGQRSATAVSQGICILTAESLQHAALLACAPGGRPCPPDGQGSQHLNIMSVEWAAFHGS